MSDVIGLETTLTVEEAAEIWSCSREDAGEIVARGPFPATGDAQRPIRRVDVDLEQGRRWTRSDPAHPGRVEVECRLWSAKRRRASGWMGTTEGAEILGIAPSYARRLAVSGRLPAEQDAFGRWWFEADRIQLIANGRAFRREHGMSTSRWPFT
ncbi:hypothetical protein ACQPYH_06340 [Kribbella sp. CA-245084]|uniref:hypothetical protein n=1 Tax=Kribbella sp. CA-245084 TaxID=3239940 RepID=UPI003D8CB776